MSAPRIDGYQFGHLIVDGHEHTDDVILLPGRVIADWWRKEGHALHPEDMGEILAARPDLLIVGQGAHGRLSVTAAAQKALEQAGIEWIAQPTAQACETYNRLCDQRAVAAALHLTC